MSELTLSKNALTQDQCITVVCHQMNKTGETTSTDSDYQWNLVPSINVFFGEENTSSDLIQRLAHFFAKQYHGYRWIMLQKELLRITLKECGGNRQKAAHILGVSEKTIYNKINEFHLK